MGNITESQIANPVQNHPDHASKSAGTATQHLLFIDGVRGLAIFWVLLFHCWYFNGSAVPQWWNPIVTTAGVNLFLVLSGFCLYYGIASRPERPLPTWGNYAWRRFRRIYPPYAVVVIFYTICALLMIASGRTWVEGPNTVSETFISSLVHLSLFHTYSPYKLTLNHPLWSIGLEASFYVAFPFLVLSARKVGMWLTLIAVILVPIACKLLIYKWAIDPEITGWPGAEINSFFFFF